MKAFLAVARRELQERKLILLAAAVAGAIPFLVPLSRGLHGAEASDARQWTALILAVAFAVGLAISLGLTTLGGEIANRRIGFYWTRPISGLSLWAGKLTGVWLLAMLAALLAFLPSLIVDGVRVLPSDLPSMKPGLVPLALLGLIAVSHALSIIVRSRSTLLLLDVIAFGIAYLATRAMSLPLARIFAGSAVVTNFQIAEVSLGLGALAAGAAAVLVGRTQIRKAHRALSLTLWSMVASGLAIAAAHTTWVTTAAPSNLTQIYSMDPGTSKGWVTVTGYARANTATFAFDVNSRRFARVPTTFRAVAYSRSGNRAAWFEAEGRNSVRVISWNLDQPDSRPYSTRLLLQAFPATAILSDDGARLAVYDYELLSVYDISSGSLLGSARVTGRLWAGLGLFLTPTRVRLFPEVEPGRRISILEFDIAAKRLLRTGAIVGDRLDPFFAISPDGDRVIVCDRGTEQVVLYDGLTGNRRAVLMDDRNNGWARACFLSGGRIAVSTADGSRIRVLTSDGQIERDLGLPSPVWALLGEPVPGRLSLSLQKTGAVGFLDLISGKFDELTGLREIPQPFEREQSSPVSPGNEFSTLFRTQGGIGLVKVDPVSLERRVVLTGTARN